MNLKDLNSYLEEYMNLEEPIKKKFTEKLIHMFAPLISEISYNTDYYYLMTFLLYATEKPEIYKLLLDYCMIDDTLMKETKLFL